LTALAIVAVAAVIAPIWSSAPITLGLATVVLIGGAAEAQVRGRRRWLVAPALLAATVAAAAVADAAGMAEVVVLVAYDAVLLAVVVVEGVVTRSPGWSTLTDLAVDLGREPVRDVASLTALIRAEPGLEDDLSAAIDAARRWESSNARTRAELRLAVVEVDQSRRRLVTAAAEARARLASEIGSSAVVTLRSLAGRADVAGLTPGVQRALASLEAAVAGLRPPGLDSGVAAAVRDLPLVAELSVQLDLSDTRCPTVVEDTLFAVAAESLGNVAKYAGPCGVTVSYEVVAGSAELSVSDDGRGGARPGSGSGLAGLADRVEALGGRFTVRSPDGAGTTITAGVPISQGAATAPAAEE
jgi:signal transduction histidine kinase